MTGKTRKLKDGKRESAKCKTQVEVSLIFYKGLNCLLLGLMLTAVAQIVLARPSWALSGPGSKGTTSDGKQKFKSPRALKGFELIIGGCFLFLESDIYDYDEQKSTLGGAGSLGFLYRPIPFFGVGFLVGAGGIRRVEKDDGSDQTPFVPAAVQTRAYLPMGIVDLWAEFFIGYGVLKLTRSGAPGKLVYVLHGPWFGGGLGTDFFVLPMLAIGVEVKVGDLVHLDEEGLNQGKLHNLLVSVGINLKWNVSFARGKH